MSGASIPGSCRTEPACPCPESMTGSSPSASPHQKLAEIFDARIQTLTTTHRYFRVAAHRFLSYLQTDFPQLRQLSELRRDPHLLGWLRSLAREDPPLSKSTR